MGGDLLKVVEGTRISRRISASFNSTFIALIPKVDNHVSMNDFRPISLCNCIYKVVSKVIARRIEEILSINISEEQFGFLEGRQIHEAIGVSREGLYTIKPKKKSEGKYLKLFLQIL